MQQNFSRRDLLLGAMALTLPTVSLAAPTKNFAQRADVQKWAKRIAQQEKLPYRWIIDNLAKAKHIPTSVRIMDQPRLTAGNKPDDWFAHRKNFMNAVRVNAGLEFVKKHRKTILAVQRQYRIPGAVVVSIIGIETIFGKRQGDYRALDTLTTLSFDHKRRADFFRKELVSYLKLCRKTKADPAVMKGSFAGAVGMCQFMPSNILAYGVDYDKNGRIDLNNSAADAIASVANYLVKHNWQSTLPIAWECDATPALYQRLKAGGGKTHTTLAKAKAAGVKLKESALVPGHTPVMLIQLKSPQKDTWRLGTENFAAIMRYNRSYFYAETVRELAMALIEADPALAGPMKLAKDTPHQVIEGDNVPTTETSQSVQTQAPKQSPIRETVEDVQTPQKAPETPQSATHPARQAPTTSEGVRIDLTPREAPQTTPQPSGSTRSNFIRETETVIDSHPVKRLPESPLPEPGSTYAPAPAPGEPTVYAIPDYSQPVMPDGVPLEARVKDWSDTVITPAVDPSIFDK
ncbi:MAG: lytic murein transglycosylase B [Sutterellaceae bacterium]|nr:lytic murein transglycosylase B [Sutterellaceae bacterium]